MADTLQRVKEIKGEVLMAFGAIDPHVPEAARKTVVQALEAAGISHKVLLYEGADHTFMRDDGDRFDPVATDQVWAEVTAFLAQRFGNHRG